MNSERRTLASKVNQRRFPPTVSSRSPSPIERAPHPVKRMPLRVFQHKSLHSDILKDPQKAVDVYALASKPAQGRNSAKGLHACPVNPTAKVEGAQVGDAVAVEDAQEVEVAVLLESRLLV